jgi:hypothetical protein
VWHTIPYLSCRLHGPRACAGANSTRRLCPDPQVAASGAGYSFRLVLDDPTAGSWTLLPVLGPPSARGRDCDHLLLFCHLVTSGERLDAEVDGAGWVGP